MNWFINWYFLLKKIYIQKSKWLWMKEIYYKDIIKWFDILNELIREYNIKKKNIYNMNEIENSIKMF